jgi:hypothetical protein
MEGPSRSRSTARTKATEYQAALATLRPLPRVAQPVKDGVGRTDTSWNPWQGVFLRLVERLHGYWLY